MITIAKVNIKGVIVSNDDLEIYQWFGIEAVSPNMVAEQIAQAKGGPIEVEINSPGGDVFAGSEMYTALMDYPGYVTTKVVGVAASAASVAAMGGKKVVISPTAQIMIHNVSSLARGDYRDHRHSSEMLENYNKSIANAYILKSGMSMEEALELMNQETWFTAQQALEKGLVDEIMFEDTSAPRLVASAGIQQLIPAAVIDRVRNELLKNKQSPPPPLEPKTVTQQAPNKASLSFYQKKLNLQGRV